MRLAILVAILLAGTASPALAQDSAPVGKRVDRLEREMRAVQRKVFPNGGGTLVEPEIAQPSIAAQPVGVPAGSAVADLTSRVDALERQLATLTGQAEENSNRLHMLEQNFNALRRDTEGRLGAIEHPTPPAAQPAADQPATPPAANDPDEAVDAADAGEAAYTAGFHLWEAKKYGEAETTLAAMAKKYPKHARASYANNLLGRAYLDDGKPATAAKVFLANYQANPKGERAPDSLYFLGQALMDLNKAPEACKVYDELQDVYGSSMRDWVKQRLPKARADAKCD
jgi:TolA-binding protein